MISNITFHNLKNLHLYIIINIKIIEIHYLPIRENYSLLFRFIVDITILLYSFSHY